MPADVHTTTLAMHTRDGVRLVGDLYRPARNGDPVREPLPVILFRTPYDRTKIESAAGLASRWARSGYACFVQDCRGRYASEGTFYKYVNEAEDGYDTIEWIAQQGWCDGSVGTTGTSYLCHVQLFAAALAPPHLKAMFCCKGGFFNAHTTGIRQGGALEARQIVWAYKEACASREARDNPAVRAALQATDLAEALRSYPWTRGASPLAPVPAYEGYLFDQIEQALWSPFWEKVGLNAEARLDAFADVPTFLLCGWYDIYAWSMVDFFTHLSQTKKGPIVMVMGPWEHGGEGRVAGEVDFGERALLAGNIAADRFALERAWFDRWLKGNAGSGAPDRSSIRYFRMSAGPGGRSPEGLIRADGAWHSSRTWPPPDGAGKSLYLSQDSMTDSAPLRSGSRAFDTDPRSPLPTLGGNMIRYGNILWPGAYDQRERAEFFLCGEPGRPLAGRPDVLVWRTPPLHADFEVTGSPRAELHVSSSAPDTDIALKLVDERPDGFALNITHGIARLRFRDGYDREVFLNPGDICRVDLRCYPTSHRFRKGHRLRVDISGSNFPHFDLNPNTGEPLGRTTVTRVARNTIHFGRDCPSRIDLPVRPSADA